MIEEIRALIDDLIARGSLEAPPTFFEVTTAIAFELFKRAGVTIAVLEVGLGGRLDSTNIVQPIAAAITSIDFDHEQYLGHTLAAIAAEKAGVIRRDIPVVVGPVPMEARDVLVAMCDLAGAEFIEADADSRIDSKIEDGRTIVRLVTPIRDYGWVPLGLRGDHQMPNAVVAVRLLEELGRLMPVPAESIIAGIRDVRWAGRLQMIELPGGRRVLLDAAHNPAGAWALASYLKREFPEPLPIVFGAMRDKDVALMLKHLLPAASMMVMTEPATPRALQRIRAGGNRAQGRTQGEDRSGARPGKSTRARVEPMSCGVRRRIDFSRRQCSRQSRAVGARSLTPLSRF